MGQFVELSLILVFAAFFGLVAKFLRQPLILGYILAGLVIGPNFLNLLNATHTIELLSKLGITTLLFIVGLHLSPRIIKEIGLVSLTGGFLQITITSVAGFFLSRFLGFDFLASLYIAIGITLSSTIVVLKLLSDKKDLNSLYGKLTIGFLLIQDIVASILLLILPTLNGTDNLALSVLPLLFKGLIVFLILFLISWQLLSRLSTAAASSSELLFLFSLAWGFGIASMFQVLGFSVETGALIAGVTLSTTPFAHEISSRLKPLRDFFVVLFFILLGSQLTFHNLPNLILPVLALSFFVILISPLIVLITMNLLGFTKRVGFLTGLGLAQISEFSLVLSQLGFQIGHLNRDILSIITLVAIITITISTYLILHAESIYSRLAKPLSFLELVKSKPQVSTGSETRDTILFGYHRVGQDFVKVFQKLKRNFLVVDFDPQVITHLKQQNLPHLFGDAQDIEFLNSLNLSQLKLVVSTIPDFETNLFLIKTVKSKSPKSIILVISHSTTEAKQLYKAGASYVIMPHYLGAKYASRLIKKFQESKKLYSHARRTHQKFLSNRKES